MHFFLLLLYFVFLNASVFNIGRWITARITNVPFGESPLRIESYTLGMLIYLLCISILKSLGCSWLVVSALSLLPSIIRPGVIPSFFSLLKTETSFKFILWLSVIILLGVSLFDTVNGINTIWVNNYGDLPFHLGMISSFTFGENFPPEYHIYSGLPLSYPWFINLWTANLWWLSPDFYSLKIIFVLQWTTIWGLIYYLLNGDKKWISPWIILFGGGSVLFFAKHLAGNIDPSYFNHNLIHKNHPWTPFLSTIWVTQRTAMLGTLCLFSGLRCFERYFDCQPNPHQHSIKSELILSGLLIGLSIFAHGYLFLVGTLYILSLLVLTKDIKGILFFCLALTSCFLFLPYALDKQSLIHFTNGWMDSGQASRIWLTNAPLWLFWLICGFLKKGRRLETAILCAIFISANIVSLVGWEWDQIKIFLGVYLIFGFIVSKTNGTEVEPSKTTFVKRHLLNTLILITLASPSIYETCRVICFPKANQIYSPDALHKSIAIRRSFSPQAVFLAVPKHNSLITLSGHKLFMGYEGTLSSHGIDYKKRKQLLNHLEQIRDCPDSKNLPIDIRHNCPQYLLWTADEKNKFAKTLNISDFTSSTRLKYVLRLRLNIGNNR